MQLTITTDYAIRVVCFLATHQQMKCASELSKELGIPENYIPKVMKRLKQASLITSTEGIRGGYHLAKHPEHISLLDVISSTENTMEINRCSKKYQDDDEEILESSNVEKVLSELQDNYNRKLKKIMISDVVGLDDSFPVSEEIKAMEQKEEETVLSKGDVKMIFQTMVQAEKKLREREREIKEQYWDMISLLIMVLNHNQLLDEEHQDDISFYTKCVYEKIREYYPERKITQQEIEDVSKLAPIHDIGKVQVPIEILNKKGSLTTEEMDRVKIHPEIGAKMTLHFPKGATTEKLNEYSYQICRFHHERYDGNGYPDGLKGEEIPLCAQVVGLVDAYDALIHERPYKQKLAHEKAIQMIVNGECGVFSDSLLSCFLAAAMEPKWIKKVKED